MGKYYLGLQSGLQTNFSVVDGSGVIADLDLSGIYLSATGKAADANLLDGQDSAYYRDISNITGALTTGSSLLYGDGSGRFANAVIGSGLLFTGGVLYATGTTSGGSSDADTLNEQSGSYYLNYANFTGTPQVSGSFTGTLSGTASNADLLDNEDGSYYRNVVNITGLARLSGYFTGDFTGYARLDSIQFNTGTTGAGTLNVGELEWADDLGTLQLGLKGGNITHYVGQQLFERVKNQSTETLAKGTVVYVSGAQGNRIVPSPAIATADISSATVFGIVAESIAAGSEGFVIQDGLLQGLNTTGYAEGSILWLSPTVSGGITTNKPIAPDHLVMVGFCVRSHATVGEIAVKIQNGYEIDELHNVRITGVQNGQILAYNSASGVWFNTNITGGANIAVTSNGSGSVTIATTSGSYTGNFVGTASNADLLDNLDSTYFRDGANLTGTINATQLSGQTSAYYRNLANLTGTAQLSGSFTGTLTGTASNADLLDNLDSTYFRNASNLTGTASLSGTFSGIFRSDASTTGGEKINLPHGVAPTSPVNGDLWTTVSGLYVQVSGSTVGPLSTGSAGGGGVVVETFTGSTTWTKATGAVTIEVICIGGGGGGASGRKGTGSTGGGGGGGGGALSRMVFPASLIGDTETVTVGAGGTGGNAVTTNSTNGSLGNPGGTSSFGSWVRAGGGQRGQVGQAGNTNGGGGGGALAVSVPTAINADGIGGQGGAGGTSTGSTGFSAEYGGGGGGSGFASNAGANGGSSIYAAPGGGGGGGISSTTAYAGGNGGKTGAYTAGGGATGGAIGANGSDGASPSSSYCGTAAGGGGGSRTGNAGAGGTGGIGAGGGGGGAGLDNVGDSGAGGSGGPGRVIVITYK